MKIAIMGTGGVGGYFGARLAAGGQAVAFIARGPHLEAMRAKGLQVLSANGDLLIHPVKATDQPYSVGHVDVVMIGVKLWSTDEAVAAIKPMVGPATAVVSFIGVADVTLLAKESTERTQMGFATMGLVWLIYTAVCLPLTLGGRRLERALNRKGFAPADAN